MAVCSPGFQFPWKRSLGGLRRDHHGNEGSRSWSQYPYGRAYILETVERSRL